MPWDAASFRRKHNQSLSPTQAKSAAKQANAILSKTGDEGMAIAVANKSASKLGRGHQSVKRTALEK